MKERSLFIGSPRYNLVKKFVHHILSRCDVHDGLHRCGKIFYQIFMSLRAIANQEANLHGTTTRINLRSVAKMGSVAGTTFARHG